MLLVNLARKLWEFARRHRLAASGAVLAVVMAVLAVVMVAGSYLAVPSTPADAASVSTLAGARGAVAEHLGVDGTPLAVPIGHRCGWTIYISLRTGRPSGPQKLSSADLGVARADLIGGTLDFDVLAVHRNVPAFQVGDNESGQEFIPATIVTREGAAIPTEAFLETSDPGLVYSAPVPEQSMVGGPVVDWDWRLLAIADPNDSDYYNAIVGEFSDAMSPENLGALATC